MKKIGIWLKAARLQLHILGILPVLVGSLLALEKNGVFQVRSFILAELIILFVLIATAFANDYADADSDKNNRNFTVFSGGSRVIVNGLITKREMLIATIIAASIAIGLSIVSIAFLGGSPLTLVLCLIGLFVGVGYSVPPLKINYRGFGELFVAVMYSFFCLLFGYTTQSGYGFDIGIVYFSIPIAFSMFSTILITEFPDYESDKLANKKTILTVFGKKTSFSAYFTGVVLLFVSIALLYRLSILRIFAVPVLFLFLIFCAFLGIRSTYRHRDSPGNITLLCGATISMNVFLNAVISMNLLLGQ